METDAARELADRFGEYAQTVWASEVSDVDWDPDLDRIVRTSIQRVLEALVPDGEIGLVKSTDGPLAAALTDDALYVVGLSRITADNVNHSITPVARRIGFDQPDRVISASVAHRPGPRRHARDAVALRVRARPTHGQGRRGAGHRLSAIDRRQARLAVPVVSLPAAG